MSRIEEGATGSGDSIFTEQQEHQQQLEDREPVRIPQREAVQHQLSVPPRTHVNTIDEMPDPSLLLARRCRKISQIAIRFYEEQAMERLRERARTPEPSSSSDDDGSDSNNSDTRSREGLDEDQRFSKEEMNTEEQGVVDGAERCILSDQVMKHCLGDEHDSLELTSFNEDEHPKLLENENPESFCGHSACSEDHKLRAPEAPDELAAPVDDGNDDDDSLNFTIHGSPESRYATYHLLVDPDQEDKAVEIPLCSCKRPHMLSFHLSWVAFFVAFFLWFSMTPLLSEIGKSLNLDREEIWTSSVLAVAPSMVTRILTGPLNDKYGARWVMSTTLIVSAIPTALAGLLIQDLVSLYLIRLFIGVAGSCFVTCEFWTSSLFTREIAGTSNALAAGWGNLGGAVSQLVMGTLLFPLFKWIYGGSLQSDDDASENEVNAEASDKAWRTIMIFPAIFAFVMAVLVVRYGDDTPKGNIMKRRREHQGESVGAARNLYKGLKNWNTGLLFLHYGCCFGVEITMTQAAALYFKTEFGLTTESAAAIASIFGWLNLFARGVGGYCSDMANARSGMKGRLWCQFVFLLAEGALVIFFSFTRTLASAIIIMIVCSFFVQAAEGSTFGIVPYVTPSITGTISGIVGAGGNMGGVVFALVFRGMDDRTAFLWMGAVVMLSSVLTLFVREPGYRGLFWGQDDEEVLKHRQKAKLPDVISFEISHEE